MKLAPERLLQQLRGAGRQSPPLPVYLVSGDEPLLVNEVVDALRAAALASGCAERESHVVERSFRWDEVSNSLRSLSLFSAGKLIEIRLPGAAPGDEGSRALRELAGRGADGNVVLVITPALNRKAAESAWAKALAEGGAWVETRAPDLAGLPAWISRRFAAAGLACDAEGIDLLAARVEGNLLAAQQEIDKLALLHPAATRLDAGQIRAAVADGARFDVFQLADAVLAGDVARAVRVLGGLREEGTAAPLVLWSLLREVLLLADAAAREGRDPGQVLRALGVWQSRVDLYLAALRRQRSGRRRLLYMGTECDRIVKGARPGDAWNALLELTLALAGRPLQGAELA